MAVNNLLRLGDILSNTNYTSRAEETLKLFSGRLNTSPYAMPFMMSNLFLYNKGFKQMMIVGMEKNDSQVQNFIQCINSHFIPNKMLMLTTRDKNQQEILNLFKNNEMIQSSIKSIGEKEDFGVNNISCVHLCENFTCGTPIRNLDELKNVLRI